jgi:hypothetical protein
MWLLAGGRSTPIGVCWLASQFIVLQQGERRFKAGFSAYGSGFCISADACGCSAGRPLARSSYVIDASMNPNTTKPMHQIPSKVRLPTMPAIMHTGLMSGEQLNRCHNQQARF